MLYSPGIFFFIITSRVEGAFARRSAEESQQRGQQWEDPTASRRIHLLGEELRGCTSREEASYRREGTGLNRLQGGGSAREDQGVWHQAGLGLKHDHNLRQRACGHKDGFEAG